MKTTFMNTLFRILCITACLQLGAFASPGAETQPFGNGEFKGRIAYSSDGNHNDPDDWAASPIALAIIAEAGLREKLVHFDYNSILPLTNPEWENIHAESVLGTAIRYGYNLSRFFDDRRNLDGSIASIVKAINASSADDPLYFIIAGPMEVPYRAIQKSDPAKLKYVYCISHSNWNDGFVSHYKFSFTKRDIIEKDIHWVQIRDQNRLLSLNRFGEVAKPHQFAAYFWMRDSRDPKVRFLWDRMIVSTRPDPSDAGMAWFLVTGDEECTPEKLKLLLEDRQPISRTAVRASIRVEAENFRHLEGLAVDRNDDRAASHRAAVRIEGASSGRMRMRFDEPFAKPSGRYDVEIRYLDQKNESARFAFFVNGAAAGPAWTSPRAGSGWTSHVIRDVDIKFGDELGMDIQGAGGRIDYIQLNAPGASVMPPEAPQVAARRRSAEAARAAPQPVPVPELDNPNGQPGQLIVAGGTPGYLKYNGGRAAFLAGPDNPETFLYLGKLNPDGTRFGGAQETIIERLGRLGLNAFHCIMWRMNRSNIKGEGDDSHSPFIDHDPSKPLNDKVLAQWETWLTALERAGVNVHLEFYDDATDVRRIGWDLDENGNLHPNEVRWITGIVERFKHHKNILWSMQESLNKLPRSRVPYFKKVAALIASVDTYNHPIIGSFVVPNDPEGDDHPDQVSPDDFVGDPHIKVVTWLHVHPHGNDFERQYREYLKYAQRDATHFVVMKNETFHAPKVGPAARRYMWSCAMAGLHALESYHNADPTDDRKKTPDETLRGDALLTVFMEQTDFHRMQPQSELAVGSTKWVLARAGESYILYTYEYSGAMGVKNLLSGRYDLLWFDTETGRQVLQSGVKVTAREAVTWKKPDVIGNELALYVRRAAPGAEPAAGQ